MRNDELSIQSMNFAVSVINLVKDLKSKHETIISKPQAFLPGQTFRTAGTNPAMFENPLIKRTLLERVIYERTRHHQTG